jgi:hypothetical protein
MPSLSVGIILRIGTIYDPGYRWRNEAGELRASVGFNAGGHSTAHLQGPPAALRELAAALIEAADQAEGADDPASALVEAVRG